jgi:hypothetical protein
MSAKFYFGRCPAGWRCRVNVTALERDGGRGMFEVGHACGGRDAVTAHIGAGAGVVLTPTHLLKSGS